MKKIVAIAALISSVAFTAHAEEVTPRGAAKFIGEVIAAQTLCKFKVPNDVVQPFVIIAVNDMGEAAAKVASVDAAVVIASAFNNSTRYNQQMYCRDMKRAILGEEI